MSPCVLQKAGECQSEHRCEHSVWKAPLEECVGSARPGEGVCAEGAAAAESVEFVGGTWLRLGGWLCDGWG
eukprot:128446-Chlamydomonas_euryale.AAC.2